MAVDPSHKGKTFPPATYTLNQSKVREFLLAIGEADTYTLEEGDPLPPTVPTIVTFWGGGGLESALNEIGVDIWTVLHAEQEYTYTRPITVGDALTATTRIADIYERAALNFVSFETDFVDANGETVAQGRSLIVVQQPEEQTEAEAS